jgi:lysophospholipase L1-like esterase
MLSDITPQQHFQHVDFSVSAIGNFGIPGIKVGGLLSKGTGIPGNAEFNPYYTRFASNPGTSTPLNDILFSQGTFFSLLIGSNDVLEYANSGGVKPLTDAAAFASQYEAVVRALCSSNAQVKGVLINLPDLTEAPFFHVVTDQIAKTAIPLDAASATQLNGAYQLQGHNVGFTAGNSNRLLIETGTGQIRQFRPGKDRITYAFALDGQTSLLGTLPIMVCGQQVGVGKGMGIADFANTVNTPFGPVPKAYPIPNRYVLDEDELAQAKAAIVQFNASIAKISTMEEFADKLAFADLYTAFHELRTKGFKNSQGLVVITASMNPGGGFSADGLHPNPKGHAWLANVVINAINGRFGSNMATYDIAKFRGNEFPVNQ